MMKKILLAVLFVFMAVSTGTASDSPLPGELLKKRIAAANSKIQSIDSKSLRGWIDEGEKEFILLDVREPGEVSAGKIEADDYLSIPRGLVEMQFIRKVKELDKVVVIYCLKGSRGALAAEALTELGYTNVYNLQGGLLAWIEGGHPVSNFFGEFEMGNFDSNFEKKKS